MSYIHSDYEVKASFSKIACIEVAKRNYADKRIRMELLWANQWAETIDNRCEVVITPTYKEE